jgi:hypothetical protein
MSSTHGIQADIPVRLGALMNRLTSSATLFFGPAIPSPTVTRLSIGMLAAVTKGLELEERHESEGGYGTKNLKMPGTPVKKVETSHNLAGDRPWQTLLYPVWYTILCSDFIVKFYWGSLPPPLSENARISRDLLQVVLIRMCC